MMYSNVNAALFRLFAKEHGTTLLFEVQLTTFDGPVLAIVILIKIFMNMCLNLVMKHTLKEIRI